MRLFAPPPSRFFAFRGLTLAVLLVVAAALAFPQADALGQGGPAVGISADPPIARVNSPVEIVVSGVLGGPWPASSLRVDVFGPGDPSADPSSLPRVATLSREVGDLSGRFRLTVPLAELEGVSRAGGYRAVATLASGPDKSVEGAGWFGLAPGGTEPVEIAFVWPVAYGIHQAPDGAFVDQALEAAVVPRSEASGSLYALFQTIDRYPAWRMSWAVEPVLLTQLRDMADGFVLRTPGAEELEVPESEQAPQLAARALEAFRAVTAQDSVQVLGAPYALPSFPFLGSEGWDDGLNQMQLGKSLLQEILSLTDTLDSAYVPGGDLTTESLSYLAGASVDYAVASAAVAGDLVEAPDEAGRPVRVRDRRNNRVTLLFSSQPIRAVLSDPWEPDRFFAALASQAAAAPGAPLVAVPASDYGLPPFDFLDAVGAGLTEANFIRTATLAELVDRHPPPTRPIFLTRYGGLAGGFVGQAYQERLRGAHALVEDLASATDSDRAPLNDIRLLLFQAESRYWFAEGVDPTVANLGLSFVDRAAARVREEFDKIDVAGDKSVLMMGSGGDVPVAVVNQAGYPIEARLVFEGDGLAVDAEVEQTITLGPQENIVQVPVEVGAGSGELEVRVYLGQTQVDSETISVRSLALGSLLPWFLLALVVVAAIVVAALRFR